jgi:hypothetical protein
MNKWQRKIMPTLNQFPRYWNDARNPHKPDEPKTCTKMKLFETTNLEPRSFPYWEHFVTLSSTPKLDKTFNPTRVPSESDFNDVGDVMCMDTPCRMENKAAKKAKYKGHWYDLHLKAIEHWRSSLSSCCKRFKTRQTRNPTPIWPI